MKTEVWPHSVKATFSHDLDKYSHDTIFLLLSDHAGEVNICSCDKTITEEVHPVQIYHIAQVS